MIEIYRMINRMESNIGNRCTVNLSVKGASLIFDVYWFGGKHYRAAITDRQMIMAVGGLSSLEDMIVREARNYEEKP